MESHAPQLLLKEATQRKRQGDFEGAISCLRQAVSKAGWAGLALRDRLRIPKYLAEAGKQDAAWKEYNRLIAQISVKAKDLFSLSIGLYEIHRAMALHLRKEKRGADAFAHELQSFLYFGLSRVGSYLNEVNEIKRLEQEGIITSDDKSGLKALALGNARNSYEEGKRLLSHEAVEELLNSSLKQDSVRPQLAEILNRHLESYPKVDVDAILREIQCIWRP